MAIPRLMARDKIVSYLAQGLARRVNGMSANRRAFPLITFVIVVLTRDDSEWSERAFKYVR